MRIVITAFTATTLLATTAIAAFADCITGGVVQIGIRSGDPEKDTFGLSCETMAVEHAGSVSSAPHRTAISIGVPTSEPEKDTVGYAIAASAE
jgi:hypothetical protein